MYCFEGILARKQFCSKSQAGVCVKLFQRFKVNSSLPVLNVLNTGRFLSAILVVQISGALPCLFLQSLMGNYDVSTQHFNCL